MEELEDELVVAELGQGCDVRMPERGSVRSGHDRAQLVTRELVRGDVEREDGDGEINEGVGFPLFGGREEMCSGTYKPPFGARPAKTA